MKQFDKTNPVMDNRGFDYNAFRLPQYDVNRTIRYIEETLPVRVLALAECSSRAWGYANETSDHDLRAICLPLPWLQDVYCKAQANNRVVVDYRIDVQCFMVQSAFHLAQDTNLSIYESLYSPIQYSHPSPERAALGDYVTQSLKKTLRHYYSDRRMFGALCGNLSRIVRHKISEGRPEKVSIKLTHKSRVLALRFAQMLRQCVDGLTVDVSLDNLYSEHSANVIRSSLSFDSDEALSRDAIKNLWAFQTAADSMIAESLYLPRPDTQNRAGFQFVNDAYRETARELFAYFAKNL